MAGEEIEPERLRAAARAAAAGADALVCEGVGGLLVPLSLVAMRETTAYLVRDLAVDLGYPLVIAASPGLGTINHTLLTIEAARAAGLEVAAVVLTPWPEEPSEIERSNRETIAALGEVEVQTLPPLDLADPATWPAAQPRPGVTMTSRWSRRARPRSRRRAAIAAAASGSAGGFLASSSARATSPRTAFAMWETGLRLPPLSLKARTASSVACFGFQAAA